MRILHVSTWKARCGIAGYAENLVDHLNERGIDNAAFPLVPAEIRTMIGPDLEMLFDKIRNEAQAYDLVHIQHEFSFFASPTQMQSLKNFGRLMGILRSTKRPIVVTFHTYPYFKFAVPISRAKLRDTALSHTWRWRVARHFRGTRTGCHAIVHTMDGRQSLVASGFDPRNVSLSPMGHEARKLNSDAESRANAKRALGIPADSVVLSMFGFVASHKGHEIALKALKLLPKKYVLAIVGGRHADAGSDLTLNNIARAWRKGDPNRLFMTGYADRPTIDLYQEATDFCLAPYLPCSLAASGALPWALTSKRPTIASAIPAFTEIQRQGDCMLMVAPNAPHELAWAVKRLDADKQLQARLVENAETYTRTNSWNVSAACHLAVYQQMLSAHGATRRLRFPAHGPSTLQAKPAESSPAQTGQKAA